MAIATPPMCDEMRMLVEVILIPNPCHHPPLTTMSTELGTMQPTGNAHGFCMVRRVASFQSDSPKLWQPSYTGAMQP